MQREINELLVNVTQKLNMVQQDKPITINFINAAGIAWNFLTFCHLFH